MYVKNPKSLTRCLICLLLQVERFLSHCSYLQGSYSGEDGYLALHDKLEAWERSHTAGGQPGAVGARRLAFYLKSCWDQQCYACMTG